MISFPPAPGVTADRLEAASLQRMVPSEDSSRSEVPMWTLLDKRPREIHELVGGLAQFFSLPPERTDEFAPMRSKETLRAVAQSGWSPVLEGVPRARVRILRLHDRVLSRLARPAFHEGGASGQTYCGQELSQIFLIIYPDGSNCLAFGIRWKTSNYADDSWTTLGELFPRMMLLRHQSLDRQSAGWAFPEGRSPVGDSGGSRVEGFFAGLGSALGPDAKPIGVRYICDWLRGREAPEVPGSSTRYTQLQSAIVLAAAPSGLLPRSLENACVRLSRGYDETYELEPSDTSDDSTWRPRGNRILSISREGCASITWATPESSQNFEFEKWPSLFTFSDRGPGSTLGIYALLALHLRQEKAILGEYARKAADCANFVREVELKRVQYAKDSVREVIQATRRSSLAHILGSTFADCGGTTGYSRFWKSLRRSLALEPDLRELQGQVDALDSELARMDEHDRYRSDSRLAWILALLTAAIVPSTWLGSVVALGGGPWLRENQGLAIVLVIGSTLGLFFFFISLAWVKRRQGS